MHLNTFDFTTLLDLTAAIARHKNHTGYYLIRVNNRSLMIASEFGSKTYVYKVALPARKYWKVASELKQIFNRPNKTKCFAEIVDATPDPGDFIAYFKKGLRGEKIASILRPVPPARPLPTPLPTTK